jgi:cytoskeleton protein RodZ
VSPPVAALLAPNAPAPPQAGSPTTVVPPLPNAPRVFGASADEPSRILLTARKDAWIQVRDLDSRIVSERTLHPGDTYRVPDRPGLSLRTGNGSGLDIAVDGKAAPAIGGTVRHNVALDPGRLMTGTAIVE